MPRVDSIAYKVAEVLRDRLDGATMAEIGKAIQARHPSVLPHSIRSAVYQHLGDHGERLFRREKSPGRRARYFLA